MAAGSASEVKCVTVGCHEPSGFTHAGCGQWQKPLEYLPLRSRRSRFIEAPAYDAERGERAAPLLDALLEWEVGIELLGHLARHRVKPVFHGSSAAAPCSLPRRSRAVARSGRVPTSRVSRISKSAALPKPSACVTL